MFSLTNLFTIANVTELVCVAKGWFAIVVMEPTMVLLTSRNLNSFSTSSTGALIPSMLLGCGLKVMYLLKIFAIVFTYYL